MSMSKSLMSRASNASSQMLEQLANRSQSKIFKVEGTFNDQQMRIIWNSLGLYISRNLRMGRGVTIPKFGVFTFTPPQVNLKGVTNEVQRDKRPRMPVFLIQKQFIKGVALKSAIFYHQQFGLGLRPYTAIGATGDIPITKMNLLEVASYANMNKDATELALHRIIKYIGDKILNGQSLSLEIPNVGSLIYRNNLVAVKFNEFLQRDTRTILTKSVDERIKKGQMKLTTDNLKKFAYLSQMNSKLLGKEDDFLNIDQKTTQYLKNTFGFHSDPQNLNRSITNFDRTFATKDFDYKNRMLKSSQISRVSQSNGFNKSLNLNRQYNMALRIVKQWIKNNSFDSKNSFQDFAKMAQKPNKQALNQDDVWEACKNISVDITQQQANELFRILDANRDGFVTKDDWNKNINFDINGLLKQFVNNVKQKKYKISDILNIMGLQGVSKVSIYNLKDGIKKINGSLSEDEAFYLSRYITKGQLEINIENVLEALHLNENIDRYITIDDDWKDKFLARLKKKMIDRGFMEEQLENRMRFYDKNNSGYVQQTDFKNVLAEIGINLTLSELIKIVKIFPINKNNNQICYQALIDELLKINYPHIQPIKQDQFVHKIWQQLLHLQTLPFQLPISVRRLTSHLQSTLFKDQQQNHLKSLLAKIDVNGNGQICKQDIIAYRQKIRVNYKSKQVNEKINQIQLEQLVNKIRQKSIKKKISYFDLFKKLDSNNDGFITLEEWLKNIGQIINLTNDQKESLFNFIDKDNIKMIDYKVFLSLMNGSTNHSKVEKFDWAEDIIRKIKQWHRGSSLTIQDAFRVVDSDSDSYLNQKDLNNFLIDKLKLQQREITHVRLEKLSKLLDTYKRGKVDLTDWKRIIGQNVQVNWIKDAKQQIGIVLSRMFKSVSQAFTQIGQGQKKLVFALFCKWIKSNKVLSGFMANDDMIKHLFSQLDSHKKGYLLENDFIGLFGQYKWKSQQVREFIETLQTKFKTCNEVFRCMCSYKPKQNINYDEFEKFTVEVFGERFKKSDIKNIWDKLVGNKNLLSHHQFINMFGKQSGWSQKGNPIDQQYPKDDWKYQDYNIIKGTQIRTNQFKYQEREDMEVQCNKIVNNVRDILLTSPKSLQQVFNEVDTQKQGGITNLQFKKAFRSLNIALTSKQIDLLLNYCDFKLETLINWKQFIRRFNLKADKIKIINRITPKMQHLSDLLHYYMISPKDAYRKWNNPRTGYMSFQQFHKMIKQLYILAAQPLPQFSIIKEFFDHIDIRKDNQLDFQQFTQTFRNFRPPSLLMGTTPVAGEVRSQNQNKKSQEEKQLPIRQHEIPLFKHSKKYQQFVQLIGRNRRYLKQCIQKENPNKQQLVSFKIIDKILSEFATEHKFNLESDLIRNVVAFSMTGDKVDYRLLLDSYKERNQSISQFPKQKFF